MANNIASSLREHSHHTLMDGSRDLLNTAADEIDRLRLTDAEREAIKSAIWDYEQNDDDAGCASMVATLRGLLARLGGKR